MSAISQAEDQRRRANPWHEDGSRTPDVGEALAVGVVGNAAVLWSLRLESPDTASPSHALGPGVMASRRACRTALPRSLPFLWRDVSRETDSYAPGFSLLSGNRRHLQRLEGPSYGLSMALAYASKLLGQALSPTFAASAEIDASGRLHPVSGLEIKLQQIESEATRVRTMLVAKAQADKLRGIAGRVRVVGVSSLAHAINLCFRDVESWFLARAKKSEAREATVDSLFRLALGSRGASVDWTPIHRSAEALLNSRLPLSEGELRRLDFAAAVANRHENNRGAFRQRPTSDWISRYPQPLRLKILSQVIQQCADTGSPSVDDVHTLAREFRVRDSEAFPDHLRLEGALARLAAACGRLEDALESQIRLAESWIARLDVSELSYNLAEAWRLVGALGPNDHQRRVTQLKELADHARACGDLNIDGDPFVRLARTKADVQLGLDVDPERILELMACETLPLILRLRLRRWLLRCDPKATPPEGYEALEVRAGSEEVAAVEAFTELDRSSDKAEVKEALRCLESQRPAVIQRLAAAALRRGQAVAEFIREAHPYG